MNYPIPPHDSWKMKDSSKIQTYMDCPRQYFFRYMLGWDKGRPSVHLTFGVALHKAIEYMTTHGYGQKEISNAYMLFMSVYRETEPESFDDDNKPKDPQNGYRAIEAYASKYSSQEEEVLWTETAGSVSIDDKRSLSFRLDAVVQDKRGIFVRDYKTGSKQSRQWTDQWVQKVQVGTYTHATRCYFKDVWGMEIRGIFLYKATSPEREYGYVDFIDIPVMKTNDMMQDWLETVRWWFGQIDEQTKRLSICKDSDVVMKAFPKNTESCTKYFGCPYLDVCPIWANPIRRADNPPVDFEIRWWDPREDEKEANKVVHLKI